MTAVIVERELEYVGDDGVRAGSVRILAPDEDEGSWRCRYQFSWPGYERQFAMNGVDAWQALHLTMHIVPSALFAADDFKSGRIGLWGKSLTTYEEVCQLFDVKPVEGPAQ